MVKKISLSVLLMIFLTASCFAGEALDKYYPIFKTCLDKLGYNFIINGETYTVTMNYKNLLNYMEELDVESIRMVASIAIEWNQNVEFPEFDELRSDEGRLKLCRAIQTAQAGAILKAADSIISKDRIWL